MFYSDFVQAFTLLIVCNLMPGKPVSEAHRLKVSCLYDCLLFRLLLLLSVNVGMHV